MTLAVIEEIAILDALITNEYVELRAAEKLGIARKTMSVRCQKYGVKRTKGKGILAPAVNRRREDLRREYGC